jgi:hypothetical protein
VAALTDALDGAQLQKVQTVGFLPGGFQALEADEFSHIEERASHGGHRDPSANGPILVMELAAMNPEPLSATNTLTAGSRSHVDGPRPRLGETPKRGSAAVAEQRSLTVGQHGRKPSSLLAQSRVAYGVDLTVHQSKPPALKAPLNRVLRKPQRD